ncbi:MAG TPA: xanthine dehydrogenase family protein molybdopterin-binding subunit [Candidatus Acidoferrales bacterium]|nr:xanthine dehydrogenase family protein molybdopterin-binding subunit [Candidatus Acidoferrales bacterium]
MAYRVIGQPVPRVEVAGKVTGEARYTADVCLPGTLWAKVLRSPYPHARIVRIDTARAARAPGVRAVLTGADVRGILIGRRYRDVPVLAQERVRFVGERVAAVAAEDAEAAQEALALIDVAYEELPAVFDPEEALQEGAPILHPDVNSYPGLPKPLAAPSNLFSHDVWERGDLREGFSQADLVVENTFTVSRQHQAFLEPHCCLVWIDEQERVQVWSPNKVPHGLKQSLAVALGIAKETIRVNPVTIGADFGGKGCPLDEPLCYMLALRTGRPVKMVMEYQEEFIAGAPRHKAIVHMKTGVKRDGTIVAHEMEAILDSGAYGGLRPSASLGGIAHAGGCYRSPNARIVVKRVYTNNIPGGQMRAPGEPQGFFAAESQMDCVARALGMDPVEFRLKNLIEDGDKTMTGAHYRDIRAKETLSAAVKAAGYGKPKPPNVGRGVAMGYRAPGSGSTSVVLTLSPDGSVVLQTSVFEQGTGTYTTLRQVVAEELSLDPGEVQVKVLDTDSGVPFDTGIGGSRGTRVAAGAAFRAVTEVKEELSNLAETLLGWRKEETAVAGHHLVHKKSRRRHRWDELLKRAGRPLTKEVVNRDNEHAPVTAFAAQVAEVAVDPETGEVTLRRFTTAHDTGIIINPVGHQGQIDGGVVQGVGYALMEQVRVEDGRVTTTNFGDYKIPTARDIPELATILLKSETGVGPYKTKGIGENPVAPVAAAIANAVEDAVGVRIRDLPITAEKIYQALKKAKRPE